jgi:hypothetical protein
MGDDLSRGLHELVQLIEQRLVLDLLSGFANGQMRAPVVLVLGEPAVSFTCPIA